MYFPQNDTTNALLHSILSSMCNGRNYTQRRRKEDEAAGAANQKGHCKIGELTHNSPHHFPAFLGKIFILPTCRILINSICLFLKEPRKPSCERGGGLNSSKFQMYTRKVLEKGTSCPRVAPAPSGQRGQLPQLPPSLRRP